MPIITSYPFKKAPLDAGDEIIISDSKSSDPRFKTKTTNLRAIGSFTTALLQERQQVINFFFGSSQGSKDKTNLLKK